MAEVPQFIEQPLRTAVDLAHRNIVHPWLTRGEALSPQPDREIAHERAIDLMDRAQKIEPLMTAMSRFFAYRDPILKINLFDGCLAPNPLGIAAGFDKNARVFSFLDDDPEFNPRERFIVDPKTLPLP